MAEAVSDPAEREGKSGGQHGTIRILVKVTGTGMDQSDVTRVVEPFYTTKSDGSGLGVSMMHGFVEQRRSRFEIDSEIGGRARIALYPPGVARKHKHAVTSVSEAKVLAEKKCRW